MGHFALLTGCCLGHKHRFNIKYLNPNVPTKLQESVLDRSDMFFVMPNEIGMFSQYGS